MWRTRQKKNGLTGADAGKNGTPGPAAGVSPTGVDAVWAGLLVEVGPIRSTHLRQGTPAIFGPNALVIRFAPAYRSAYEATADDTTQEVIRAALKRTTGADWAVRVERSADAAASVVVPPPESAPLRAADVLGLPMLRKVTDSLAGALVKLDDGFDPAGGPPTVPHEG